MSELTAEQGVVIEAQVFVPDGVKDGLNVAL